MSKAKRRQRIFIDYLRNGRGNTAIVSYSTRAREGAPVAVPVRRDELKPSLTGDRYDIDAVRRRVQSLRSDPWQDFERSRRRVTPATLRALGVKEDSP
jgi:bifunctional non-homologous end joining protein LigD